MSNSTSVDNTRIGAEYDDLEPSMELTNQILKRTGATPSTTSSSSTFPSTKVTDTQQPANSSADDANNAFGTPQCRQQSSSNLFTSNPFGTSTNSSSKSTSKKSSKTSKSSSPGGSSRSSPSTNNNVDEEINLEDPQDVDSAPTSSSSSITHYISKKLSIPSEMMMVVDMAGKKR